MSHIPGMRGGGIPARVPTIPHSRPPSTAQRAPGTVQAVLAVIMLGLGAVFPLFSDVLSVVISGFEKPHPEERNLRKESKPRFCTTITAARVYFP